MNCIGLLGVAAGERGLVGGALDELLVAIERRRPPVGLLIEPAGGPLRRGRRGVHVVRVRQAEVVVEAVPQRMMGRDVRVIAQVPLADARRGVASRLEGLGQRDLLAGQAAGRVAPQDAEPVVAHAAADRIAAGEQRGPARACRPRRPSRSR